MRESRRGVPGDLAVVFDEKRAFAGIGLYDPHSPIRVRVLHGGNPRTIDDDFFADRMMTALARREPLERDADTTAYRLVHGENDRLPGLVIDRYESTLVARLDTAAWVPHLAHVLGPALELTEASRVVLRASRRIIETLPTGFEDGATIVGSPPNGPIGFRENGLWFAADVERGQKTGHFLDQRDNRRLAATRAGGARVLDVFCNSGGFSVYAAAAGARSVHSVDLSPHAAAATERHLERNRSELDFDTRTTSAVADAFDEMQALADRRERFDLVIVDPPSFAPNAAAVPAARRSYRRLTALAIDLLGTGGTLFQASCSSRIGDVEFHDLIADELDAVGWKSTNEIRTGHALDHPVGFPEGAYLKAALTDAQPRG